jgi:SMI1-KNR4 cell-wall
MSITFKNLGLSEADINQATSYGLRYTKQQKKDLLKSSKLSKPDDAQLDELQRSTGLFPHDFASFLRTQNGGIPSKQNILINSRELVISRFLACAGNQQVYDSIENYLKVYASRIPEQMLPIACSPGGDLVLLSLSGESPGRIFYWFHEKESDGDGTNYYDNVLLIADSFDDLLNRLTA